MTLINDNCPLDSVAEDETDDLAKEEFNELVAALNISLVKSMPAVEEEAQLDEFPAVRKLHFASLLYT